MYYTIYSNECIAKDVFKMILWGDTSKIKNSGQFINIKIDGLFLRRPISVCDYDDKSITIIYKVVGDGTEKMSKMKCPDKLDCLTGLGNGFSVLLSGNSPLLIGGGVGVPPLYNLAKQLKNKNLTVVLGFNSKDDVFYVDEFKEFTDKVYVTTIDGTFGEGGFVTDVVKRLDGYSYFYTCGPEPMLKAVYDVTKSSGQLSFEKRMGCGFGACMGCTCETKYATKRICKEGPVLFKEEIIW